MNIIFLFLGILLLNGSTAATATNYSEEQINEMREKIQKLEMKIEEGKLKDDLLASKDSHIEDLRNTISHLQHSNSDLNENVKQFIKEEFSKIDSNFSKLQLYNNLTISDYAAQIKFNESALHNCELKLNETENINRDYVDQLVIKNETIDSNFSKLQLYNNLTIADYATQMKSNESALHNCELKLNETENINRQYVDQLVIKNETILENLKKISQLELKVKFIEIMLDRKRDELVKQKEIITELQEEIYQLTEEKDLGENLTSCTTYGDSNDIHTIQISQSESFPVLCNSEIAGPGWIVIQQRINGKENFQRDWQTYKNGFGNFSEDFFLGLEKIHQLTYNQPHELYIHMERFDGSTFFARYDSFQIGSEDSHYQLSNLGSYSGNAEADRMRYSEGENFSTFDNDNDNNLDNCAVHRHSGWWFHSCADCNLNGKYYQREVYKNDSNWWLPWYSLKTIKMLIRKRDS